MVDGQNSFSVRPPKTSNSSAVNCFYCSKSVTNSAIECKKCKETFHPSCFKRAQEKKSSACRHEEFAGQDDELVVENSSTSREALLHRIIQELEEKNRLLAENCQLLREKIGFLEVNSGYVLATIPPRPNPATNPQQVNTKKTPAVVNVMNRQQTNVEATASNEVKKKNDVNAANITSTRGKQNEQTRDASKLSQQHQITPAAVQRALELAHSNASTTNAETEWKTQGRRRSRNQNDVSKRKKTLGTSEGSNGFIGVEKKVWIYLYRVQRTVSPILVQDFIKKKPGFSEMDIQVSELPTDENKNKCFLVTAPFSLKDDMYKPSFWPKDVGIKRYDFRLQSKYTSQKPQFF